MQNKKEKKKKKVKIIIYWKVSIVPHNSFPSCEDQKK